MALPSSGLVLSGNTLYGTAEFGGSAGKGTVFAVNADGTDFTNLHNFSALNNYTNEDGTNPQAGLVLSGRTLYGVGYNVGSEGYGMIFALDTNGSHFVNLYNFVGVPPSPGPYTNSAGTYPYGGLLLSGNNLYGTGNDGGNSGNGTVFKLVIPITLFYQNIGNAIVYSWNDPSFVLQSAPAVTGTYTNIASATSPYTNSITGVQRYLRLLVSQ
ncbi:MAG TPA: choice-of-anchor tandem repeat GloVer-containing protein [Verrucomicrobiae bacterium]|nr:choice-of-anchor tandem repeat GloVer-containing protein [Verrucomicrobiae bacterium]